MAFQKLKNLLRILQLCEYDLEFFGNFLKNRRPGLKTGGPIWTTKAVLMFFLAAFVPFSAPEKKLVLALKLLKPMEAVIVFLIVWLAKLKLKRHKKFIKIGISGSYGKTTTKEFVAVLLSQKYKVLKTPENINTLLGAARLVLKKLNKEHEVLLVEMAAYHQGDIKALCDLIKPDIGIITGIGESHLERFGSLENIIKTKFELAEAISVKKGFLLVNSDVGKSNFPRKSDFKIFWYGLNPAVGLTFSAQNLKVFPDTLGFDIYKKGEFFIKVKVNILGRHALEPILAAVTIADYLGLNRAEILTGLAAIKPLERRLYPLPVKNGILIIDDTYNISLKSVQAALDFLQVAYPEKRKIVVTAGLVEQGEKSAENNRKFGNILKGVDLILMPVNSKIGYIKEGLENESKLAVFDNAAKLNLEMPRVFKSGDIVLLFPYDLPEQYF